MSASEVMLRLRSKCFVLFDLYRSVHGLLQSFSYFAVHGLFSYTEKFDKVTLDNAVVRVSDLPDAEVLIL